MSLGGLLPGFPPSVELGAGALWQGGGSSSTAGSTGKAVGKGVALLQPLHQAPGVQRLIDKNATSSHRGSPLAPATRQSPPGVAEESEGRSQFLSWDDPDQPAGPVPEELEAMLPHQGNLAAPKANSRRPVVLNSETSRMTPGMWPTLYSESRSTRLAAASRGPDQRDGLRLGAGAASFYARQKPPPPAAQTTMASMQQQSPSVQAADPWERAVQEAPSVAAMDAEEAAQAFFRSWDKAAAEKEAAIAAAAVPAATPLAAALPVPLAAPLASPLAAPLAAPAPMLLGLHAWSARENEAIVAAAAAAAANLGASAAAAVGDEQTQQLLMQQHELLAQMTAEARLEERSAEPQLAAAPVAPPQARSGPMPISKTPCSFFLVGRCRNGLACRFSHDTDKTVEVQQPRGSSEVMCRFFAMGRCAKGSQCTFLHGRDIT